jgi:hypothetical protein
MGAFKTGFHIGVCCKDMDTAIAFMSLMFDEPEHKKFSPYGVEFKKVKPEIPLALDGGMNGV